MRTGTDAFTPLERAALDGLAWELSAQLPDLSGQIEEASPGQRRVRGPIFLTETIVDRRRPSPPDGHSGRLGTIHVQIDNLEHPIAFQAELLGGRLIALQGDAYGQDLTAVDLDGDVVDQVFRLREDGLPVPHDPRDRDDAIRQASPLRKLQANPDPPDPELERLYSATPSTALDVLFGTKSASTSRSPQTPLEVAGSLIFGARALSQGPPLRPTEPNPEDFTSVRIGVIVLSVILFAALVLLFRLPLIFSGFIAIWIGRALLAKTTVRAIARMLSPRVT